MRGVRTIIAWDRMAELLEKHRTMLSADPQLQIVGVPDATTIVELHRERQARLLILDTTMPGPTPEEICREVRADTDLRSVSLIVVGTEGSAAAMARCAANRSFIRPLSKDEFLGAVRLLVEVATRKDYRVLLSVQLRGRLGSTPFFGRSENISATGMLFSTNHALEAGDLVELTLVLPGLGQLHTKAGIVRSVESAGRDHRYGARFIDPGRVAYQMIETFIQRRLA